MTNLPDYVTFKSLPGTPLQHIFSAAGDDLLELLQGLFTFDPSTRVTATQVLLCLLALNSLLGCASLLLEDYFVWTICILYLKDEKYKLHVEREIC